MLPIGCWSEMNVLKRADLLKIPRKEGITVPAAATLSVNPCTAYRMLCDFDTMKPGTVYNIYCFINHIKRLMYSRADI